MPKREGINLLNTVKSSFFDRFIDWTLTIGRIVVILTELIALGAFLYRFSLDQQLIDLHSKIKQEQAVVGYLKDSEATYRNLQSRLTVASNYSKIGSAKVKVFKDIVSFAPPGLIFNEFSLTNEHLKIASQVYSVSALSSFIDSVKKYNNVQKILIDKIQNTAETGIIDVSMNIIFNDKAYAN
jgi:hypothetical protein